jgi:hypothetical protein
MMRRILVVTLAVAMITTLLPASLFAEETRSQADNAQLTRIAEGLKVSRIVDVRATRIVNAPARLQEAQQGAPSEPFFKTKQGKITLGVAILAASIAGGIMLTRGPDPRPWP